MLTLLGATCLVGAAGLLGEREARRERQRLAATEGLLTALTVLEAEIGYLGTDLADGFARAAAAAPATRALFQAAAAGLCRGGSAAAVWGDAVEIWTRRVGLPRRHSEILGGLRAAWGPWRAEDCLRHIRLVQRLLQDEQERMRARLDQACRLWRYLGLSGGLVLALLLY